MKWIHARWFMYVKKQNKLTYLNSMKMKRRHVILETLKNNTYSVLHNKSSLCCLFAWNNKYFPCSFFLVILLSQSTVNLKLENIRTKYIKHIFYGLLKQYFLPACDLNICFDPFFHSIESQSQSSKIKRIKKFRSCRGSRLRCVF